MFVFLNSEFCFIIASEYFPYKVRTILNQLVIVFFFLISRINMKKTPPI